MGPFACVALEGFEPSYHDFVGRCSSVELQDGETSSVAQLLPLRFATFSEGSDTGSFVETYGIEPYGVTLQGSPASQSYPRSGADGI